MLLFIASILGTAAVAQDGGTPGGRPQPAMLFFDWGQGELRRDDSETLDKVADAWRARPSAHLRLTGHTDRSGSLWANRASGLKRAAKVRDELQERGVPRNRMTIVSFGEEQPLVATEDGVREVQNRRVVIEFEE